MAQLIQRCTQMLIFTNCHCIIICHTESHGRRINLSKPINISLEFFCNWIKQWTRRKILRAWQISVFNTQKVWGRIQSDMRKTKKLKYTLVPFEKPGMWKINTTRTPPYQIVYCWPMKRIATVAYRGKDHM